MMKDRDLEPDGSTLSDRDLAAGLGTQVSRLVKLMRKESRNDEQLSLTERSTLSNIYNLGPILPGELASMEKVTTQAMSQVINQLLEQGLIEKNTSTEDRRKSIITLTEKGRLLVQRRKREKEEWLSRSISDKLNAAERQVLIEAIAILTKLVG
jgi:DNA-binding MarR family transcriptional regulator